MSKDTKTAVEAARAVSQALKKSLEDIKGNIKYTPQEAAFKIKNELQKHIVEVRDYLVDLQNKEVLCKAGRQVTCKN